MTTSGIWVIGDVHGEYDKLLQLISRLPEGARICFCGDLIDRGPDSAKVMKLVFDNNYDCVLGNHELMMLRSSIDKFEKMSWQNCGGRETVVSYEKYDDALWHSHIELIESLPYFKYYEFDGHKPLVVSHSYIHNDWIDKDHKYSLDDAEDILWAHAYDKERFDEDKEIRNNIFNIFGHSPVKEPIVTKTYAMIDTGATYAKYGTLSAIHYPSLKVIKHINQTKE